MMTITSAKGFSKLGSALNLHGIVMTVHETISQILIGKGGS